MAFRSSLNDAYCFLADVIDTELFQKIPHLLLTYSLQAFENADSRYEPNDDHSLKSIIDMCKSISYTFDRCDEHLDSKTFFLANFLVLIAETEGHFNLYNFILQEYKQILKTDKNYVTTDYLKATLITFLYEICSTKDVNSVKATLTLAEENKMPVLLDQGINLSMIGFAPKHNHFISDGYCADNNCIFLMFCIWEAYKVFNEPVLEYLISMYSTIPFDIILLLKTFYSQEWLDEFTPLSYKPLKWILERFKCQEIEDIDFILRTACQYKMFDTVEYLVSQCTKFDAIACLKMFLYEEDDIEFSSDFDFNEQLFFFYFFEN